MSHSQQDEQQKLEEYLEAKAKEEKESQQQQDAESLSEYEACVLRESARVKELMAEARNKAQDK
ncbi:MULTISPECIES: hypothetical protein [unclassified Psychrobacter]|uniref:hypothetical protein n=1 Tax=unclassified Psychrobacter TaxID=196806 RepID=UPI00040A9E3A|nr:MULTISPECIES: hypothetical protein [unclassified Psychrobacter]